MPASLIAAGTAQPLPRRTPRSPAEATVRARLAPLGCCIALAVLTAGRISANDSIATQPLIIPTIELRGGATALHADIAGHHGLFLLDTGAGVTTVTPATAAIAACHPWGQLTGFRATGQRLDTSRCDGLRLSLRGRSFAAPIASVLDLAPLVGPGMPKLSGVVALDIFAGKAITIRPLARELVVETASSLRDRTKGAHQVPVRLVRDVEGVALSVDGAVDTPAGRAWMELDIGNLGPILVGQHVATSLGLSATEADRQPADFALVGGVAVRGPARVGRLIMDGDIGQSVLRRWDVTLDLANGRAWFQPATARCRRC